jgi:hypothetical protein
MRVSNKKENIIVTNKYQCKEEEDMKQKPAAD